VKLPKSFLAVNLSEAFDFQESQNSESTDVLEMKPSGRSTATRDPDPAAGEEEARATSGEPGDDGQRDSQPGSG